MNHMASNFAPPVSIVVPVRNEQRFLTSSVAGIVGQGYPGPMEIILVVAPSEDDTERIAERLADGDERLRVAGSRGVIETALVERKVTLTTSDRSPRTLAPAPQLGR